MIDDVRLMRLQPGDVIVIDNDALPPYEPDGPDVIEEIRAAIEDVRPDLKDRVVVIAMPGGAKNMAVLRGDEAVSV